MIEREAKMAREDWGLSMDASDYACLDVMSLRTTVVAQSGIDFRVTVSRSQEIEGDFRVVGIRPQET
ncbi:hypothetical protein Tco_0476671, partial [Tanacetum coccineum]